jgi:hypothetical protein
MFGAEWLRGCAPRGICECWGSVSLRGAALRTRLTQAPREKAFLCSVLPDFYHKLNDHAPLLFLRKNIFFDFPSLRRIFLSAREVGEERKASHARENNLFWIIL